MSGYVPGGGSSVSSEQPLATRIDVVGTLTYSGKAAPGSLTSAPVWQIQLIDETDDVIVTWADGDASYDNVWDNRLSLTYT